MFIDFREEGGERETEGEGERDSKTERGTDTSMGCFPLLPQPEIKPRDQSHNLGMCPDQKSNQQPCGVQG